MRPPKGDPCKEAANSLHDLFRVDRMVVRLSSFATVLGLLAAVGSGSSATTFDSRAETGSAAIYSVRPDGHGRRLVARPNPPVPYFARSPDGTHIAFFRAEDGAVYISRPSGANRVQVTPPGSGYGAPVFSSDGEKLALGTPGTSCGPRCTTLGSLYVVDADGRNLHRVADEGGGPSWSSDGRQIAYRGPLGIYVVAAAGGSSRLVGPDGRLHVWAPRGRRIAYIGSKGGYGVPCFVNADGSGRRCMSGFSAVWPPVWSPDASRIAFTYAGRKSWLTVARADGRGLRRFTVRAQRPRPLAWSPDGNRLVYEEGFGVQRFLVRPLAAKARSTVVASAPVRGRLTEDVRWRAGRISYVVYEAVSALTPGRWSPARR
jgi:dipeptidyl aminopeptidase/acylaminoacyl peptidase